MKKKIIAFFIGSSILMTGCSAEDRLNQLAESTSSPTVTVAVPTATPGPVVKKLSLKEKGTIGDWEVTVKKVMAKRKITNGKYRYFQAKKGKTYAVYTLTVKNNGKKEEKFLPFIGVIGQIVQAKVVDQNKKEYKPTQLMGYDKDIVAQIIKPGSKKTGIVAFEIPQKVGKKVKQLTLTFEKDKDKLVVMD